MECAKKNHTFITALFALPCPPPLLLMPLLRQMQARPPAALPLSSLAGPASGRSLSSQVRLSLSPFLLGRLMRGAFPAIGR